MASYSYAVVRTGVRQQCCQCVNSFELNGHESEAPHTRSRA